MKAILILLISVLPLLSKVCLYPDDRAVELKFEKGKVLYVGLPTLQNNTEYRLDLFKDNTYFIRKKEQDSSIKEWMGRWHIEEATRLVLSSQDNIPLYFSIFDDQTLTLLDEDGKASDSFFEYTLNASDTLNSLELSLELEGMFSYMDGAASFKECGSSKVLPVAFEAEYKELEKAYLENKTVDGESLKAFFKGKVEWRKSADRDEKVPILVVNKFSYIVPKESCQTLGSVANFGNTYWKLTILNETPIKRSATQKEIHMIFEKRNLKGFSGCNRFSARYKHAEGDTVYLKSGIKASRKYCKDSLESEFFDALRAMKYYKIKGEYLEIYDEKHHRQARFESVYIY